MKLKFSSKLVAFPLLISVLLIAAFLYFSSDEKPPIKDPSIVESSTAINTKDPNTISVGVFLPDNSRDSFISSEFKKGVELALEQLTKKSQSNKYNLHVEFHHIPNDIEQVFKLTRQLFKSDNYHLFISATYEKATIELVRLANQYKTPLIYTRDGPPMTCNIGMPELKSNYVWGTGLTSEMKLEPTLIELAAKHGKENPRPDLYIFSSQGATSKSESEAISSLASELGFNLTGEAIVDYRETDLFQRIRRIFQKHPDVLVLATENPTTDIFYRQAAKMSVSADMTLISFKSIEHKFSSLGADLDGVHAVSKYSADLDNALNIKLKNLWREKYGLDSSPTELAVSSAYASIMIAAEAFEKSGSFKALNFAKAMEELVLELPQGKVIVSKSNNLLILPLYLVVVRDRGYSNPVYLGDLSHPGLSGCVFEQQEDDEPINSEYDD